MPIKSYLAHPQSGKKEALIQELSKFENCEIVPAENEDLLVVVTDTSDEIADKKLTEQIEAIDSLKLLALVSGFNTPINK
jgi:nitrate reductase NapAB chaperone NapD